MKKRNCLPKLTQTEFICELCGNSFPKTWAGNRFGRFDTIQCRNIANSRKRKAIVGKKCPICGKLKYGQVSPVCIKCGREKIKGHTYWKPEEIDYIKNHYPKEGAGPISKVLNKTYNQVRDRAGKLGVKLSEETFYRLVHVKAKEFMTINNPMKKPEVQQKVKNWIASHPEIAEKTFSALQTGHQKLEKSKPSKLEFKLREVLTKHGIKFEPSALIGNKIVVDIKIGNIIIQADGDWWHGHPRFEPLNERQISQQKRDRSQEAYLKKCGFTIVRFWEHDFSEEKILSILREHNLIGVPQISCINPTPISQEGMIRGTSNI